MELEELDREVAAAETRIGELASALTRAKFDQEHLRNERRTVRRLEGRPDVEFAAPPVEVPPVVAEHVAQASSDYRGQRGALEMKLAASNRELRVLEKELAEVNATNDRFRADIAHALRANNNAKGAQERRTITHELYMLLVAVPRPLLVYFLFRFRFHNLSSVKLAATAFLLVTAITWANGARRWRRPASGDAFHAVLAEALAWAFSGAVFADHILIF